MTLSVNYIKELVKSKIVYKEKFDFNNFNLTTCEDKVVSRSSELSLTQILFR